MLVELGPLLVTGPSAGTGLVLVLALVLPGSTSSGTEPRLTALFSCIGLR
jgi:hypothetical protein